MFSEIRGVPSIDQYSYLPVEENSNQLIFQRLTLNRVNTIDVQDLETPLIEICDQQTNNPYSDNLNENYKRLSDSLDTCDEFLSAGYTDCMIETIRYLIEEENLEPEHPVVLNLTKHLESSRIRLLNDLHSDVSNNNDNVLVVTEQEDVSQNTPYECLYSCKFLNVHDNR